MNIKIFFSWQTSTKEKYNKSFLSDAIKQSISNIEKLPEYSTIKFELVQTVLEEGTSRIADKILTEVIPSSDIFITDLTPEPSPFLNFKRNRKLRPNSNVLIEFGIAHGNFELDKIICVLNTEYGSPSDSNTEWPFDLRHLEYPIRYKLNRRLFSNLESIKTSFVQELTGKLRLTLDYAIRNEKNKFRPFLHGSKWSENSGFTFKTNEAIELIFKNLSESIVNPKQTIRLIGLSGLGKTRILHQFANNEQTDSAQIVNRVLYFNFNHEPTYNLNAFVRGLIDKEEDRIIIIDNCPREKHKDILSEFESNSNKNILITIGDNPEEIELNAIKGVNYIQIKKDDLSSVVDDILAEDFGELDSSKLKKIKEFAQGIPMMAVLLGQSVREGDPHIGNLEDKDLLNKLLGGVEKDSDKRKMLMSCAIFNNFGYLEDKKTQINFIAREKSITNISGDDTVIQQNMEALCNQFLKREIFETKGRYLSMRPHPLAMYLAQEWLADCSSERLNNVISSIANLDEPDRKQLSEAFADQMALINYDDKAVKIIDDMFGPSGPFDNAEVLNTQLGSRLFRSFVAVNPKAVSENLNRNLFSKTIDELRNIDKGRRNLVWTLEKLVFDKQTFNQSVKLLFKLAIAENETWGNNSTAQLLHLFNIHLAGTEVNLKERLEIIEWAMSHDKIEFQELALKALQRGLSISGFSRMMGGERQGTKELIDYQPSSEEVREYWENILKRLEKIIELESPLAEEASKIAASAIYTFHRSGLLKDNLSIFNNIAKMKGFDWDEALNALETLSSRHSIRLNDNDELRSLMENLQKHDLISRFKKVGNRFDRLPFDESRKKAIEEIKILAQDFIKEDDYLKLLPELFSIHQPYSFHFGKSVGEQLKNDESIKILIDASLGVIENTPTKDRNVGVLGGLVQGLTIEEKEKFYYEISKKEEHSGVVFYLISIDPDSKKYMGILFQLVDEEKAPISFFTSFSLSPSLNKLSAAELLELMPKFFKYGSNGYYLAFDILYDATYDRPEVRNELLDLFKEIIKNYGPGKALLDTRESFKWKDLIIKTLKHTHDVEMAQLVHRSIIESMDIHNLSFTEFDVQHVYEVLIDDYLVEIWPQLSEALLADDENYYQYYCVQKFLGSRIGGLGNNIGTLFRIDADFLISWCKENSPRAAVRLASMVPIYANNNSKYDEWHPITKKLIDEFGNNVDVISHLSSNMGTFSWSGSLVPYYKSQLSLFDQLLNHKFPNVREWAESTINHLHLVIKNEKNRDEEMYL